jgi:hypothetical protein
MAKRQALPKELEGVAYSEDVNAIQEQVEKCYSKERYEDFQSAVEKIVGRYFKSVIGWGVFVWLITLIASMLLQKFFNIF